MLELGANWRTASGYPTQRASARRWAWEFLRRNVEYQRDWQRWVDAVLGAVANQPHLAVAAEALLNGRWPADFDSAAMAEAAGEFREQADLQVHSPPRLHGESEGDWARRVKSGKTEPRDRALAERWGLGRLIDPRVPVPRFAQWRRTANFTYLTWGPAAQSDRARGMVPTAPHELVIRVDLRIPQGPLIEAIAAGIKQARDWEVEQARIEPVTARLRAA